MTGNVWASKNERCGDLPVVLFWDGVDDKSRDVVEGLLVEGVEDGLGARLLSRPESFEGGLAQENRGLGFFLV